MVSLVQIHQEERYLTVGRIERKPLALKSAFQSNQSSLCSLHRSGDQGKGGLDGQVVSIRRTCDGRSQRSIKIIDEKREKSRTKEGSSRNISTYSKEVTFVILKNHARATIRKERLSSTSKARRESEKGRNARQSQNP